MTLKLNAFQYIVCQARTPFKIVNKNIFKCSRMFKFTLHIKFACAWLPHTICFFQKWFSSVKNKWPNWLSWPWNWSYVVEMHFQRSEMFKFTLYMKFASVWYQTWYAFFHIRFSVQRAWPNLNFMTLYDLEIDIVGF